MTRRTKQQKLIYYTNPRFYEKVLSQLQETEEKVCWLLAKDERLRNSDLYLITEYWRQVDDIRAVILPLHEVHHNMLAMPNTITRVRRHLQNDLGLWPPTDPEVIQKRAIKEQVIRDWIITRKSIVPSEMIV